MDPGSLRDREQRLDALVMQALDLPEEDQDDFLRGACGDDLELLAEARAFLWPEKDLGNFLETPAFANMLTGVAEAPALDSDPDASLAETVVEPSGHGSMGPAPPRSSSTGPTSTYLSSDDPRPQPDSRGGIGPLGRDTLGAYRLVGHAGSGGMGQVYVGEDPRLGRRVAVKILPPEMAERPGWLERFEREARALAALNHPNIVTIHSIDEDDGLRFLTMEYVEGETLESRVGEAMSLEDFLRIARDLAMALGAAHDRGVIHRDLKPANLMVTADGRLKILDFGIAKVVDPGMGPALSQDGQIIGTVSYMAPEQVRGEPVDARSDLFALGVVLYRLLTGEHPFRGSNSYEKFQSILSEDPQPLAERRPDLPEAVGTILHRCLEKDPDRRFQSAGELVERLDALEAARQEEKWLETHTGTFATVGPRRSRAAGWVVVVGLLAILALAAFWGILGPVRESPAPAVENTESASAVQARMERTELAIPFFENLSGDPELDWLSIGITQLLVASLAQSPDLYVAEMNEVFRILSEADISEGQGIPPEIRQDIIDTTGVDAMVHGSYDLQDGTLRVLFEFEGPGISEVATEKSLEGAGVEAIFGLVDRLSGMIFRRFGASRPALGTVEIGEATTSSVNAWKIFMQGRQWQRRSEVERAIESFEAAVEIDPGFAFAHAQLSKEYRNLGYLTPASYHAQKAFELADRLPLNDKFDVEASYYSSGWTTYGRAIETYRVGLNIYPHQRSWRNNLANLYAQFERYSEALSELESLLEQGTDFVGTYSNAATAYAATGDVDSGHRLLTEFEGRSNHWLVYFSLGYHLTDLSRFDEAATHFEQLAERSPDNLYLPYGRWRLAVLQEDWAWANREAQQAVKSTDPGASFRGRLALATNALYRGQSKDALWFLGKAIEDSEGVDRAFVHCLESSLLLDMGSYELSLQAARRAMEEGRRHWPELRGLYLAALAEEALGRPLAADALHETLREFWLRQPNVVEERQLLELAGRLDLGRGRIEEALDGLTRAANLLPPRGVEFNWHVKPPHVSIWSALGEAELAAGRPAQALEWLRRVGDSGSEHLDYPVTYVRSFYLRGLAHQHLQDPEAARQSFGRFVDLWQNGDLDRERLDEAKAGL